MWVSSLIKSSKGNCFICDQELNLKNVEFKKTKRNLPTEKIVNSHEICFHKFKNSVKYLRNFFFVLSVLDWAFLITGIVLTIVFSLKENQTVMMMTGISFIVISIVIYIFIYLITWLIYLNIATKIKLEMHGEKDLEVHISKVYKKHAYKK